MTVDPHYGMTSLPSRPRSTPARHGGRSSSICTLPPMSIPWAMQRHSHLACDRAPHSESTTTCVCSFDIAHTGSPFSTYPICYGDCVTQTAARLCSLASCWGHLLSQRSCRVRIARTAKARPAASVRSGSRTRRKVHWRRAWRHGGLMTIWCKRLGYVNIPASTLGVSG